MILLRSILSSHTKTIYLLGGLFLGLALSLVVKNVFADASTIYACVLQNGLVRVVAENTTCNNNETPLSWNIQGQPGPQGPPGPSGPPGTSGALGGYLSNDLSFLNLSTNGAPGMNYANRDFSGFNFTNSSFYGVIFEKSNLSNANFTNAVFGGTNFVNSNATNANFTGSNFNGSYMQGGNFTSANFTQTRINDPINFAIFTNANFTDSDMSQSTGIPADITGAVWSNTTCPDGTNSDTNGGTCDGHFSG